MRARENPVPEWAMGRDLILPGSPSCREPVLPPAGRLLRPSLSGNDVRGQQIDNSHSSDAMAEAQAPPEPGRPPRLWLLPFLSAAGSLRTASNRPVLHAAERIRGVHHQRPFVLERDGGDRRVMRADHLARFRCHFVNQKLPQIQGSHRFFFPTHAICGFPESMAKPLRLALNQWHCTQ